MKTGITKQYDGNFPERNLVSNQEQGAQLPQFSQYLVDEINGYQHIRDGWIEGSKDYEVYDLMVRVLRKAADKYIELESYRTQSTEVKTQGAEEENPVYVFTEDELEDFWDAARDQGMKGFTFSRKEQYLTGIQKSSTSHPQVESAGDEK